jgi:outer membrane biosynthesis protein TonB
MREYQVVIRVRGIDIAVFVSVLLHALLLALPVKQPPPPIGAAPGPMNVVIVTPQEPAPPQPVSPPEPQPTARPLPTPAIIARRTPVERPAPKVPERAVEPTPTPAPAPQVDMLAMIESRRAQRRAAEAAAARGEPPAQSGEPSPQDTATASLNRNLQSLSGREGVGGVFQILRKGTRTAEFAFNGWRPDSQRKWREVIEVDAGLNGNVELAIVKRMIELIRTHYSGDFQWESHRLGRVVTLSARAEDSEGLEDFMLREFFGPPVVNPRGHG